MSVFHPTVEANIAANMVLRMLRIGDLSLTAPGWIFHFSHSGVSLIQRRLT